MASPSESRRTVRRHPIIRHGSWSAYYLASGKRSEEPPQLFRQGLDRVRSTVEGGGGVLVDGNPPSAVLLDGDEGLDGVDVRGQVRLAGRHHAGDGPEYGNLGRQEAHLADFPDIGCRLVVRKDLAKVGRDLGLPIDRGAIEADDVDIFGVEGGRVAPVPAVQLLPVEV